MTILGFTPLSSSWYADTGICGAGQRTMCFHTGMTAGFVWDLGTPQERQSTPQETADILTEIDHHFRTQLDGLTYAHNW